jgi:gas vesicle protein
MNPFKNFDWSGKSIAKVIGLLLLAIAALSLAATLVGFAFRTVVNTTSQSAIYGKGGGVSYDMAMEEMSYGSSPRALSDDGYYYEPNPSFSNGDDAEAYEVKYYSGTVKTRKLDKTCAVISGLKGRPDVIFEDSNKNEDYCYYSFKVVKEKADEIVKIVEGLDPEVLNVNTQSIKKNIDVIEDELSILQNKLNSIEETLENAEDAYDDISDLATRQQDAETLAMVIDSKLNLIERLTTQKLQVKEQIDRYNESKANQMDRLNYTFFNINVYKDLIFDWKQIKDTWNYEAKQLVRDINEVFQAITLNLVTYLVRFAQFVLYLFISLFLLKFVWMGVKKIWKMNYKKGKK